MSRICNRAFSDYVGACVFRIDLKPESWQPGHQEAFMDHESLTSKHRCLQAGSDMTTTAAATATATATATAAATAAAATAAAAAAAAAATAATVATATASATAAATAVAVTVITNMRKLS